MVKIILKGENVGSIKRVENGGNSAPNQIGKHGESGTNGKT